MVLGSDEPSEQPLADIPERERCYAGGEEHNKQRNLPRHPWSFLAERLQHGQPFADFFLAWRTSWRPGPMHQDK